MQWTLLPVIAGALLIPAAASAQERRQFDVYGSLAAARVFRAEDQSFGTGVSPGAGAEWRMGHGWSVGVEGSRVAGLTPHTLTCAPPPGITCSGSAREGVLGVSVLSFTLAKYFGTRARVEPFLVGGYGVVRSHTVSSRTLVHDDSWSIQEIEERGTGSGFTAGGGLRIRIGEHATLRPEWRLYDGSIAGRDNLAVMRSSIAAGYNW